MEIKVITLFPEVINPFKEWSMIKKAEEIGILNIETHNLRDWAVDKHGTVDSRPYGGGPGMILRPEPVFNAIHNIQESTINHQSSVILMSAKGKTFNQKIAEKLSKLDEIILICGHYEGVDERIREHMVDTDISIGNYVLSGGEIPALVVIDAVSRLLPGVLEKKSAAEVESFSPGLKKIIGTRNTKHVTRNTLLEFPQYTRPQEFKGWKVPDILLSGDHQKIAEWRKNKIIKKKND
jgi:tRNA (guanine37-N1)-methyltransferase